MVTFIANRNSECCFEPDIKSTKIGEEPINTHLRETLHANVEWRALKKVFLFRSFRHRQRSMFWCPLYAIWWTQKKAWAALAAFPGRQATFRRAHPAHALSRAETRHSSSGSLSCWPRQAAPSQLPTHLTENTPTAHLSKLENTEETCERVG